MRQVTSAQLQVAAQKIRYYALRGIYRAGSGHPGGSLSIAEILAALYFEHMNIDPAQPAMEDRDRFVLSKGHAAPAYYAALALRGYFPVEELDGLRGIGSPLQGHPDKKKVKGVDMSTGSLGQGLSAACGMALRAKAKGCGYRVYCICGDGELQEGQIWEAAMAACHYKLDNLTLFVDNNNLQIDGPVDSVMSVYPIGEKLSAFGFAVQEIDGNDIDAVRVSLRKAEVHRGGPMAVVCKTTKGKGVSFMENQAGWHGAAPKEEQYRVAEEELRASIEKLGGALQ